MGTIILDFRPPELWGNKCHLRPLICDIWLQKPLQTNTPITLLLFTTLTINGQVRNFQKVIIFTFLSNKPTWWKKFKDKQNRVPALQGLTEMQMFATIQNTFMCIIPFNLQGYPRRYVCLFLFYEWKGAKNMSKGTWLISRRAGTLPKSIALHVGGEHQDVWNLPYWTLPSWTTCTEANSISGAYHVCLVSSCLSYHTTHVCLPECLTHIFNISSKRILFLHNLFPL